MSALQGQCCKAEMALGLGPAVVQVSHTHPSPQQSWSCTHVHANATCSLSVWSSNAIDIPLVGLGNGSRADACQWPLYPGVVFQRDVLLSNGGQSYGSITEVTVLPHPAMTFHFSAISLGSPCAGIFVHCFAWSLTRMLLGPVQDYNTAMNLLAHGFSSM